MAGGHPAPRSRAGSKAACDACCDCPLGEPAAQAVVGKGARHARLMQVGELPGDREDLAGHAFVGPAGPLLVTVRPSALLRLRESDFDTGFSDFVRDLERAAARA